MKRREDMAVRLESEYRLDLTRRELVKVVVGSAVVGLVMWLVVALIALIPTA